MTFDIVVPTYKRPEKLKRLLNSIPEDWKYRTWVYFDNNDYETKDEIVKAFPEIIARVMGHKYQAFGIWNFHLKTSFNNNIMIYICDDTQILEGTLENIEKHFEEKFPDTDGVVTFKQANMDGTDSAMGCIGQKFSERYPNRQVFNPNYVSFYADTDLGDYAKKLGKFQYGENCLINHYHPVSGCEKDETHNIIRGHDKTVDIKINKIRKEKGLLYPESLEMIDRTQFDE